MPLECRNAKYAAIKAKLTRGPKPQSEHSTVPFFFLSFDILGHGSSFSLRFPLITHLHSKSPSLQHRSLHILSSVSRCLVVVVHAVLADVVFGVAGGAATAPTSTKDIGVGGSRGLGRGSGVRVDGGGGRSRRSRRVRVDVVERAHFEWLFSIILREE